MKQENKFMPIQSSNLESASYDGTSKVQVKFKSGGTYEYDGIDVKTWNDFEATFQSKESSGRFFREQIKKDKYKKL